MVRKALEAREAAWPSSHLQPMVRQVFDIVKALPSIDVFATDAELDAFLDLIRRRALSHRG